MSKQATKSRRAAPEVVRSLKDLADVHPGLQRELQTRMQPFIQSETLLRLQGLETTWAVASRDQLVAGQEHSEALLKFLGTTLMAHCMEGERILLPLLSRTLAQALKKEHWEMGTILSRIKADIGKAWEKAGNPAEFASAQTRVLSLVREMNGMLQDHMAQESAIFGLAMKALEKDK